MDQFKLPLGYKAWCHECGRPPFNKSTEVEVEDEVSMEDSQLPKTTTKKTIPGVGFRSIDECTRHDRDIHRQYKG